MAELSLRSLIDNEAQKAKPVKCRTCLLLQDLTGDDRAALKEALESDHLSNTVIAGALASYGVRISGSAISRHKRECSPLE